jgi:outer membrane protein TolC
MEKQKQLSRLQLKLEKSTYMPSLSASLYYQTQAQRDDWNFFNSGKWYSSSALGVTMNVPVFSSGMRRSKVKQAQIAYEKLGVSQQQLESQLNLQFDAAKNEYMNAYRVYLNKQKNRKTAERIYNVTTVKYIEGLATSLDILNTHTQFLNAENDYINSALSLLKTGEEIEKILAKEE